MFSRIEDKNEAPKATPAPDTIQIDGKQFRRADYEDPDRPGFTRPSRPFYSAVELRCCGLWDLRSPSGRRMAAHLPVERPRDPSIVRPEDAPLKLRREVEAAEAALNEVHARSAAALERRCEAVAARRRAFERRDVQGVVRAESDYKQAEQERRDIETEETPHRRRLAEAEWKIKRWIWDESLRRQGRA